MGRGASVGAAGQAQVGTTKALALAQKALNQENEDYIRKLAIQKTAEASRQRLMSRSTEITEANASGISKLIENLDGVPVKKQTKLLLDNQGALAELGTVMSHLRSVPKEVRTSILTNSRSAVAAISAFKAIQAGVPAQKVTRILTDADSARAQVLAFKALLAGVPARKVANIVANTSGAGEVAALRAQIDAVHDKTVTVYSRAVNQSTGSDAAQKKRAAGRRAGLAEASMVGEGGGPEYVIDRRTGEGYVTAGPTVTRLGDDDYVVPTEDRFRGRALGLFASLARDLGIAGYKKGKKPPHAARVVPAKIAEGGVPFDTVQSRYESAKSKHHQAEHAEQQARRDEKNAKTKDATAKAHAKAVKAHARVERLKAALDRRRQDFEAARKTDTQVKNLETDINTLADGMELADRHDDTKTFNALKKQRLGKMRHLRSMLTTALGLAGGDRKRDLKEQLSRLGLDIDTTKDATDDVADAADPSAFTKDEQDRLDRLGADLAVAELTDDTADDKGILEQILGIDQGALARAQTPGTAPAVLKAAAEAVKSTTDQLKNLTSGGGTSDLSDVQAQLEQERERTRVALQERDLNAAALTAGFGQPAQAAVPQQVIHINTLHPGDSRTLVAIGNAAKKGMSHNTTLRFPRDRARM